MTLNQFIGGFRVKVCLKHFNMQNLRITSVRALYDSNNCRSSSSTIVLEYRKFSTSWDTDSDATMSSRSLHLLKQISTSQVASIILCVRSYDEKLVTVDMLQCTAYRFFCTFEPGNEIRPQRVAITDIDELECDFLEACRTLRITFCRRDVLSLVVKCIPLRSKNAILAKCSLYKGLEPAYIVARWHSFSPLHIWELLYSPQIPDRFSIHLDPRCQWQAQTTTNLYTPSTSAVQGRQSGHEPPLMVSMIKGK